MKKIKIIFLFLMLVTQAAFAKKYNDAKELSNGSIEVTTMEAVQCEAYTSLRQPGNPSQTTTAEERGFILQNHYALIRLSIPQNATNPSAAKATVEATVVYEYEINGKIMEGQKDIILSVETNTATIKDIDYVKIDGALKATVQITRVTNISLFSGIKLAASCEGDIFRFLPPNVVVSGLHYTAPALRTDNSMKEGSLFVDWDDDLVDPFTNNVILNAGVEAYELEWTYVSNQGATEGTTLSKEEITLRDYLFKHNSSRVVTENKGYFIPLVYEKGLIIFRVRPIGKNIAGGVLTDIKGEWTIVENQTSLSNVPDEYIYPFAGLETNLNWQSSISFAEEGKNKTVVSYHDGSLRNRQAVTRINTDKRAIAGETFYDFNGRAVIHTLPVPIDGDEENNLHFRPHLNVIDTKTTISKSDYDNAAQGSSCVPLAPEFSTGSGSSRYYSGDNQFGVAGNTGQNILNKDYIPDAKKYPYTQTQYTNDNTGRIARQSGVGEAHILNSGHETKYMYGAPLQAEISRLFGNQVGLGGHYKKNSVIDPNGQVSVSYLDLDGKVIATALAGANSTGLDNLPGNKDRNISSNLATPATNKMDSDSKGKTLVHTFPVTTEVPYTFSYELTAGVHTVSCTGINSPTPVELKLAGVFNATISLYRCNTLIFSKTDSTNESFGTSATQQTRTISHTVPASEMKIGEYDLVKTVRLNQTKLNNYLKQYLTTDQYTCVLKEDDFLDHAIDSIDLSGCNLTCSECKTKMDELIESLDDQDVPLSGAEKAKLYERCEAICLESTTCLSSLYNMTASMSPDGQYGQVRRTPPGMDKTTTLDLNNPSGELDVDTKDFEVGEDEGGDPSINVDNSIVPEEFPLSIFNSANVLLPNLKLRTDFSLHRADWSRPIRVVVPGNTEENFKNQLMFTKSLHNATYEVTDYRDENGEIAYAFIQEISENVYSPAITDPSKAVLVNGDLNPRLFKVPLRYLVDVKIFLKHWKQHFANYLVPYHPEFFYYVECTTRKDINSYEEKLIDRNSPEEDISGDFLTTQTIGQDLYYQPLTPEQVLLKDPIFSNASIPQDLKNNFLDKITRYQKKFDVNGNPISDPLNPGQFLYYTMAQYATVMVNCPNPESQCKNADCESGKFLATDVEEWMGYKTLYLTERQKLLREASTRKAIEGRYYNGCIGNSGFSGSAEQQRMLTRYISVPGLDELQARANEICLNPNPPAPFNNFPFGRAIFYGRRWNGYCNQLLNFANAPYTLRRFNAIPLYDPNQTCQTDRAPLYSKKIRAFYPPHPAQSAIGGSGEICYEIFVDDEGTASYVQTECNLALADQGPIIQNAAAIKSYQSCGLCPTATQVQDILTDVIDNRVLDSIASNFNCFTSKPSFGLGQELGSFISPSLTMNTFLSWNGDYNTATQTLEGTITPSSTGFNTLIFNLVFSGSGIPKFGNTSDAEKIFKRLKVAGLSADPSGANKFKLKLYIDFNRALPDEYQVKETLLALADNNKFIPGKDRTVYRYEFEVPGTIGYRTGSGPVTPLDIQSCQFNPLCSTTQYPPYVLNLLNTLVYEDDSDANDDPEVNLPLKPYDLITTTAMEVKEGEIYDVPVRQLLGFTNADAQGVYTDNINSYLISWSGSVTANVLDGQIAYTVGGSAKSLKIKITPEDYNNDIVNTVDFTNVKTFANVRPFNMQCSAGTCPSNKFYADAVVPETINGEEAFVYHRVVIELYSFTGTSEDPVHPVSTVCEKIAGQ